MRVLERPRRDAAAARLALLAFASLGLVAVAAAVPMRDALRTIFTGAALLGYAYFAWRAMELLQGRGSARPERPAWRRHFLHEKGDGPTRPSRSEESDLTRLTASWSRPTRFARITHPTTRKE
jgi:hypothetical protein